MSERKKKGHFTPKLLCVCVCVCVPPTVISRPEGGGFTALFQNVDNVLLFPHTAETCALTLQQHAEQQTEAAKGEEEKKRCP